MIYFDKLKIVTNIRYISNINKDLFIENKKGNEILYYKYIQKFPYNLTSVPTEKSLNPAIREGIKMAKITIVYFRKKWFAKRLYSDNRKRPQEITNVAI